MNGPQNQSEAISQRESYVRAFNTTMVNIWKEKITLLGAIDRGRLYGSVVGISLSMDEKVTSVTLSQEFNEYGVYVERGTGRNTPRGNNGDIGRPNPRVKKPWMTRKYLASMFNLREFMADSLGMEICLAMTNALERIPNTRNMSEF